MDTKYTVYIHFTDGIPVKRVTKVDDVKLTDMERFIKITYKENGKNRSEVYNSDCVRSIRTFPDAF